MGFLGEISIDPRSRSSTRPESLEILFKDVSEVELLEVRYLRYRAIFFRAFFVEISSWFPCFLTFTRRDWADSGVIDLNTVLL